MLIGGTPFDPSDFVRPAATGGPSSHGAAGGAVSAATVDNGADAAAQRGRAGADQALRDKAANVAKGEKSATARDGARQSGGDPTELTPEEEQQVRELKKRDQEVRRHEQAHARAAGPYGGQPQYQYVRGPDGKQYATSGEVKIDTSEESSPEATVRKMEIVIRAALAPADPSGQDRQVAAEAKQKKAEAQAEIRAEKQEERGRALERQASSADDPASAGLPAHVIEQATQAYGRTASLSLADGGRETRVDI
ncbi:MAG: putative metalloprotease CJM1_0395 family protein [Rhodospirillales bacterium]